MVPDRDRIHYSDDKTSAWRLQCDGRRVEWTPTYEYDYAGDGHWDGPFDTFIPPYHLDTKAIDLNRCRCDACGEEWPSLFATLAACFHRQFQDRLFERSAPFYLRHKGDR